VIKSVSFDASDALALARFWAAVFGSDVDEDSTTETAFVEAAGWGGPNIWFTRVPEPKTAKNRMHFDLRAPGAVTAEVSRLQELGATVVRSYPGHTVMQDPEGNEFCVEPGPGEGAIGGSPEVDVELAKTRGNVVRPGTWRPVVC
jgi:predicted enzyme related to lactoylglutathione lyase